MQQPFKIFIKVGHQHSKYIDPLEICAIEQIESSRGAGCNKSNVHLKSREIILVDQPAYEILDLIQQGVKKHFGAKDVVPS